VARLPVYHRALATCAERGLTTVSSSDLAAAAGVKAAKLRKDLSYLGSYGTRGVGYEVAHLLACIGQELGIAQQWAVVIVGVGNLGHALAGYAGFASRGFRVAALVDADPVRAGGSVAGLAVRPLEELEDAVVSCGASIAVLAIPAPAAQEVTDRLVAAGVTSILNFAPTPLVVPAGVDLRKVDLALELQILAFHEQRKADLARGAAG